ncbi:MAG: NAD-dependent deacetylase [Frankiaceae bacterium]|nr:NAD-dependent deacetylase [Frankiaceae bacterium]
MDARELIEGARRVTVLTGAGISTDSGIPDYRGPNGLWTRNPEAARMSTLADYVADPEVRRRAWQSRRTHPAWTAQPNDGHRALVALERAGRLVALLTQNIDELHQRAGSDPELVVELHGTIWQAECLGCGARTPMADELVRVSDDVPDPACTACGGILKSATISFGQQLDPLVVQRAVDAASSCDLFLVVGSSLTVQPAAGLCTVAVDAGADLVIVNAEPTPYDAMASLVIRTPISETLTALTADSGGVR